MPKKKATGKHKPSSGLKQARTARRTINKLNIKKRRWTRYVEEIKAGKRKGNVSRWDTSGIDKHIAFLEQFAA